MINVNELEVNIRPFKVSKRAMKQYRYDVNNNENEDYETAKKKLTRNFILGELYNENERFIYRRYGNMIIKMDKVYNIIINVMNDRVHKYEFNINKNYKKQLEQILGIE